jgi:outer membrane protein
MKTLLKTTTAFLFCVLLAGPVFAQGKIATINLRKAFEDYWRTKQADAGLKDQAADMEKELKSFDADYKTAKEEYDKLVTSASDQALSSEERDKRKVGAEKKLREMQEIQQSGQQYAASARSTLDEKRRRLRENILTEVRGVISAKAKSGGYALVIDTSAETITQTPVVLYNTDENDMTEAILKQLNANAPAETPKPAEKKEEKKEEPKKEEKK